MDLQEKRDLQLLTEVELAPEITQRSLSKKLGVALGLTNLYLKRLTHKGYIKITTIPRNRIKYLLTPRGMAEKSRLTYQYMQYSLTYYQDARQRLKRTLVSLEKSGAKRIVIFGNGELAELAYLSVREMDLTLVGFVAEKDGGATFLSYPVWPIQELLNWDFDVVLIADLQASDYIQAQLLDIGVLEKKITPLVPRG